MATGKRSSGASPLSRLRALCLAFPEAHEVEAWGEPTFRVRNKLFAMYAADGNHHGAGRPSVWVKAAPGNQPFMVAHAPHRFFVPPYVGPSGWVGVYLDAAANWNELPELLADAWRLTAPKRLVAAFDAAASAAPAKARGATRAAATRKSAAKTTTKKSAAKKSAAKKTATKKSATKKSATKRVARATKPTKGAPRARRGAKRRA